MLLYGPEGVVTGTTQLKKTHQQLKELYTKLESIHAPALAEKSESVNETIDGIIDVLTTLKRDIVQPHVGKTSQKQKLCHPVSQIYHLANDEHDVLSTEPVNIDNDEDNINWNEDNSTSEASKEIANSGVDTHSATLKDVLIRDDDILPIHDYLTIEGHTVLSFAWKEYHQYYMQQISSEFG